MKMKFGTVQKAHMHCIHYLFKVANANFDCSYRNLKLKASTQTFDSLLDLFGMPADTFPKAA